ncbi:GNAT family N-acetyltransferase [Hyphomonas sp.]|jgi:putative acetyltransferase|uniref:GNAT family N-acetyltransferase n=1 Tax=Hyphomonas sp. TaxID=87 RepID=UPI0039E678C9
MTETWTRNLRLDDMDAVAALNRASFGRSAEAKITRRLHKDGDSLLSLVAHQHEEIVGHIEFFRILIDGQPEATGLGPMCVKPDVQRRGIGAGLVRMGLVILGGREERIVFVLGHEPYYPKFGFSAETAAPFKAAWSGPAFMAQVINPGAPEAGELTYPPAFG